ncbi:ATP-binding cassette sub-family G member 2 [Octodon degus]|uniref:Broad substrate specificity ATP-binding cassette transporter ABCG2 n=1 Tax=Octodon degus TaxID=10160 RepID=A0A6P6DR72_OCTDE|nr:ATP-binding cassette sub-family G member 2 [Octodon degus]
MRTPEAFQMSSSNDQFCIPLSQRNTNGLPGMTSSDLKASAEGAVLSFHNITYRVKMKSGFLSQKTVEKEILSSVNGIMKPGLNAILGPTGSGKSSLLDILAARKDPHGLSGDVLVNGAPQPANFKCNSGYVVQDDVVMGTLTVRENLQFSAALRLPTTMKNHEKNERINVVIKELGLDKVADSKVGTQFIRGVSGGERKRTSIGMELITDPAILFLDEPTTGLDSSTANAVLLLLKRMSRQGRTIIFSIHQPRYSIFKLFDSLTLLAAGKLMFHGPAQGSLDYFASAEHLCLVETLSFVFLFEQIIVTVILALVIGALYYKLEYNNAGIQNRAGVLFFLTTNQCFSSVSAVELFVVEKKLFTHEYISGYYRVASYFFAKLFSDMLPMRLLPSVIFTCIVYFMLGLKPTAAAFFTMMFTLMLVAYTASSMALAIAAGQSVVSVATLLMTITFVFMMLFSGLLVNLKTIGPWLSWLQYFSIPRYGFTALQHNEFLGQNFCPGLNTTQNDDCDNSYTICTGEQYLTNQGIELSSWGLWQNHVALACMMIIFLTIAYLKLLFLKKHS